MVPGTRQGFFNSIRGLKQGDPMSPALFILGAELLSRMLNNLTHDELFNAFYMERRGPQINHLGFADDVINFTYGTKNSLNRIMTILRDCENTSGQKINNSKSHFMVPSCVFHYNVTRIQQIIGFTREDSPLIYLGCPLYIGPWNTNNGGTLGANLHYGETFLWTSVVKDPTQSLKSGILANHRNEGGRPGKIKVSQFWNTRQWDVHKLNEIAAPHMLARILQVPIYHNPQILDEAIWTPNVSGKFTCASAWETIRRKKQHLLSNKKTWHKKLPFKWSFCLWRAIRNKLPTNDRVVAFGNPTVTRYLQ
ncbi:PREDICTED: uncharacterized protein LOC109209335 [Nicotiana attenuata]|uniref:uncharacterized protein LOC109209335 n=1 Tax=Nicotiana attenuata TaxID=49451 RepID=UPI000905C2F4|nr:PREDICTED: uncharacterized protein LOC109209335 [Nicotiana attenuata]